MQLVASLNRYAGTSQRQGDLFLNESMLSKSKAMLKKGLKVRELHGRPLGMVWGSVKG